MIHGLDEAEHGAEDAEGRGVAAGRFEHERTFGVRFLPHLAEGLERVAHFRRRHAVDDERERPQQERIVVFAEFVLERQRAARAGAGGVLAHAGEQRRVGFGPPAERGRERASGARQQLQREAEEYGHAGAAEHDERRRRLQQRAEPAAVERLRAHDERHRQRHAEQERGVGEPSGRRHRASAPVCSSSARSRTRSAAAMSAASGQGRSAGPASR